MRIVTRPDFDGIACAVLIKDALNITEPIKWVHPSDMQKGIVAIASGDIVANLPYHPNCSYWFDHHYTNRPQEPFQGLFEIVPSAAGLVHTYYREHLKRDFSELVQQADKIDSADLSLEEVLYPEKHDYILLSMTINSRNFADADYWNRLVELLQVGTIETVMADPFVADRCRQTIMDNRRYETLLIDHTHMQEHVAITDFRTCPDAPPGNRFLVYALFPNAAVNIKIRFDAGNSKKMAVSTGRSIFNDDCRVNLGALLSRFEGGGHAGAASCVFDAAKADDYIPRIITNLIENSP